MLPAVDAPAQAILSPQYTAGKMIYHTGSDGSQDDIQAILADGRGVYPATQSLNL